MRKIAAMAYGLTAYVVFLGAFVHSVGFVGNFLVPKTIDSGPAGVPLDALVIDALLLGLFAIQHSVMARPGFKAVWTRIVSPSIERSTYVLISSLLLFLLFWQWRPLPAVIWDSSGGPVQVMIQALFWLGWLVVLASSFLISHVDLFGLRQVWLNLRGKTYQHPAFVVRGLYRVVRHPLMLGFVIAFWAAPVMTLGHLVFAVATTAYILIALRFEERDLIDTLGEAYLDYRKQVPMLVPLPRAKAGESPSRR